MRTAAIAILAAAGLAGCIAKQYGPPLETGADSITVTAERTRGGLAYAAAKAPALYLSAPGDARFAAAVAAYGQKLQRAGHADDYAYNDIISLAQAAKGEDGYGDRAEFVNLVRAASQIDGAQKS